MNTAYAKFVADTGKMTPTLKEIKRKDLQERITALQGKEQQLNNTRLLKIDSVNHTAMMNLSTFAKGYGLKRFFRNSFRALQKNKIGHLIVDVRANGGGSVGLSTLLTRYMANQPFKIGDSLYATRKKGSHDKFIQNHFWNRLFINLLTKKRSEVFIILVILNGIILNQKNKIISMVKLIY